MLINLLGQKDLSTKVVSCYFVTKRSIFCQKNAVVFKKFYFCNSTLFNDDLAVIEDLPTHCQIKIDPTLTLNCFAITSFVINVSPMFSK